MTTMSIKTFKNVAAKLPVEVSVLLQAIHGVGKSQVVRQVAQSIAEAEGDPNRPFIDRRLSQMTEGDMIGLPSTDGEVTRFNPPDWVKKACDRGCTLFLDELNRATPEVMQAAFQLVLDRELNGWKLHPQTRVYSAINHTANYSVNEMDPALKDRFWAIHLVPTRDDWLDWAKTDGKIAELVVLFHQNDQTGKWLDPPKDGDPGATSTSRRSWERLSRALEHAGISDKPNDELFYPMCLGFVGTEATIAFQSFSKTVDSQVTGEEVLFDYQKAREKVKRLGQEKQNILIEKVVDFIGEKKTITPEMGPNLRDMMNDLPGELRVSMWTKLLSIAAKSANVKLTDSLQTWCVQAVLETFGSSPDDSVKLEISKKQREALDSLSVNASAAPAAKRTSRKKLGDTDRGFDEEI